MDELIIWSVFIVFGFSWWLKSYFHFQLFKKKHNSDISLFDLWFNPFSYLFAKIFIYFPFYLFKAAELNTEYNKLRVLVIGLSWVNFISFAVLATMAIYLESQG